MQKEETKTLKIMHKLTTVRKYRVCGAFARECECLGTNLVNIQ